MLVPMLNVVTIETADLGDRSYVVTDGATAAVVDPQRDIDRVLSVIESRELSVTHVLETHIHNDYVSGGLQLARQLGAEYCIAAADAVEFSRRSVRDGDLLEAGGMTIEVIHTPGHTPNHVSYGVAANGDGAADAVFTGGSLLYGAVGRTDLISPDLTVELARDQFHSARRLAELPAEAAVFPTHGFGSFCSVGPISPTTESTIGAERARNIAYVGDDEEAFVAAVITTLTDIPAYYAHMGPANRAGPAPIDLSPSEAVDVDTLYGRIHDDEWVVDLRHRRAFAGEHLAGTINIEGGPNFITYLGWLLPWGTPVTLIADDPAHIGAAQRAMARIGIDRPGGHFVGAGFVSGGRSSSYRTARFGDLAHPSAQEATVVDVRRAEEWNAGHISQAIHLPIHELQKGMGDLPPGELWVHCATAYRAGIAASLLDRAGRDVVLIDEPFLRAATAGLEIVPG